MVVIGHERIGNELRGRSITVLAEASQEECIILRFEEYPMPVVSTVVDMIVVSRKELHARRQIDGVVA